MPSANLDAERHDFAFDTLRSVRQSLPSNIVFDIGTGGARLRRLENIGFIWRGFDQTAREDIASWDLTYPCPTSEKAGAALLLDVIEHCVNPGLALINTANAIEANGYLILTAPNPRWSASRLHNVVFGSPSAFTKFHLDDNHHVFYPLPHVIEKLLQDAGFEIENYVTLDGKTSLFRHPLSFSYPAYCVLDLIRRAIELLDPSACGMSYALVARKV